MSRLRSRGGTSPGGTRPGGTRPGGARAGGAQRGVLVQTPQSDIYVALLGVALGAMIIGCLLLILVLSRYGFSTRVSSLGATPSQSLALAQPSTTGKFCTVHL